ncbi:unnamed protein product [Acanthoscelides obtectus]|uniref:Uncharacterized protein n=1 Tax=Acanthoscelides obtectus TaxID=200917 RepID=A0A9P0Q4C5_ACAOB|nr:unnamed protein product [Acanthoscelides obtectus]CAK1622500.1 hypothetical protein AOBTE_LOCUS1521 [Acanthoscelides obtectus]
MKDKGCLEDRQEDPYGYHFRGSRKIIITQNMASGSKHFQESLMADGVRHLRFNAVLIPAHSACDLTKSVSHLPNRKPCLGP